MRVLLVTIAWMILSLLAWSAAWGVLGFSIDYLVNERRWRISEGSIDLLDYTGAAGMVIVPTIFAVLGMRGKLPGIRSQRGRGFPVEVRSVE